jgi:RimJ/RimL family protein N-acetyltransferase
MAERQNSFGQPIGPQVEGWTERSFPASTPIAGRYCRVEKLDAERHAKDVFAALSEAPDARDWTYMFAGPFADLESYAAYLVREQEKRDPQHYAILDAEDGKAVGTAALMRIEPAHGVIEVGHILYSPRLQRTRAGTEAMYLLMRRVFEELGYRRYEWKCDALNAPSRRAAERYGFTFEGIFRQAIVYKGRNRDTAWYSITDKEWPAIRAAFEAWLSLDNFDAKGSQRKRLPELRAGIR